MENPATWGRAEHVINAVLANHQDNLDRLGAFRAELSLPRQIADALRHEGLLPVGRDEDGCCDACGMILDASGCPRCDGDTP